jgi:hypothetical protein
MNLLFLGSGDAGVFAAGDNGGGVVADVAGVNGPGDFVFFMVLV